MSFPKYPKYRDSGVEWLGNIPTHWGVKKVSHVAELIAGFAFPSEQFEFDPNSGIPLVRGDNVTEGWLRWGEKGRYWPFGLEYDPRYLLEENDIVIQMDGSKVGKNWAFVHKADLPALLVQRVTRVRASDVSPIFLYLLFSNEMFVRYVDRAKTDPAVPHITMKNIGDYWIPLPPSSEQSPIVAFLERETGKIDTLVSEQRRLIELLKEKRQAVISHAVTKGLNPHAPMKPSGIEWLGDVPEHWEVTQLKRIAIVQTGVAKGKDNAGRTTISVPYLRVANVQDGYLDLDEVATIDIPVEDLDRYLLRPGDVLMNEGGDFDKLGRGHIWEGQIAPCITQNHVFAVRPKINDSEWINTISGSEYAQFYFKSRSKQSTNLASISSTNLMELPVVLPPAEERSRILGFISGNTVQFDELISEAQRAIDLLQERRSALISAAVTGKIDVRGLAETEAA